MTDHPTTSPGFLLSDEAFYRRRVLGFAVAVAAFAAPLGLGLSAAMAESQRPSKPVTVRRPPAGQAPVQTRR